MLTCYSRWLRSLLLISASTRLGDTRPGVAAPPPLVKRHLPRPSRRWRVPGAVRAGQREPHERARDPSSSLRCLRRWPSRAWTAWPCSAARVPEHRAVHVLRHALALGAQRPPGLSVDVALSAARSGHLAACASVLCDATPGHMAPTLFCASRFPLSAERRYQRNASASSTATPCPFLQCAVTPGSLHRGLRELLPACQRPCVVALLVGSGRLLLADRFVFACRHRRLHRFGRPQNAPGSRRR